VLGDFQTAITAYVPKHYVHLCNYVLGMWCWVTSKLLSPSSWHRPRRSRQGGCVCSLSAIATNSLPQHHRKHCHCHNIIESIVIAKTSLKELSLPQQCHGSCQFKLTRVCSTTHAHMRARTHARTHTHTLSGTTETPWLPRP